MLIEVSKVCLWARWFSAGLHSLIFVFLPTPEYESSWLSFYFLFHGILLLSVDHYYELFQSFCLVAATEVLYKFYNSGIIACEGIPLWHIWIRNGNGWIVNTAVDKEMNHSTWPFNTTMGECCLMTMAEQPRMLNCCTTIVAEWRLVSDYPLMVTTTGCIKCNFNSCRDRDFLKGKLFYIS